MTRPIWVQFSVATTINATGTTAVDLLTGHLTQLQASERTVVAIKGYTIVQASTVASVTPDVFSVHQGFTVGSDNLVAADFPDMATDGLINPGWMHREFFRGVVTGDGTNSTQVYNFRSSLDVKSKRSLQGMGDQTLWLIHRTE